MGNRSAASGSTRPSGDVPRERSVRNRTVRICYRNQSLMTIEPDDVGAELKDIGLRRRIFEPPQPSLDGRTIDLPDVPCSRSAHQSAFGQRNNIQPDLKAIDVLLEISTSMNARRYLAGIER